MSEQQVINLGTLSIEETLSTSNANIVSANINVGTLPNDGLGDPLRIAFSKINNNFSNLISTLGGNLSSTIELTQVEDFRETTSIENNLYINQLSIFNNNVSTVTSTPLPIVSTPINSANLATQIGPFGNQLYINIGNTPNDGQGDPLRVAFGKINNNFSNLFFTTTNTTLSYTVGVLDQIIFEADANKFTQAEFKIQTSDSEGPNSQNITISAQMKNSGTNVRWTGYATIFDGSPLTNYNLEVIGGNVVIIAKPIANTTMTHFIASSITWQGDPLPGLDIELDGYMNSVMSTQNNLNITTEN